LLAMIGSSQDEVVWACHRHSSRDLQPTQPRATIKGRGAGPASNRKRTRPPWASWHGW